MERFLARQSTRIAGVVRGFDRLLFRGTLRSISFVDGMDRFLASQRVLYKDFAAFAARVTARVREIATRDGITDGLVCMFSCVESCMALTVRGDRAAKRLRLVRDDRRSVCL